MSVVAHHGGETNRDGLKELVAGRVTQAVVHILEAVEVDEQCGEARPFPARRGEHLLGAVEHERPVRQPGQRVVEGLMAQLLLRVDQVALNERLPRKNEAREDHRDHVEGQAGEDGVVPVGEQEQAEAEPDGDRREPADAAATRLVRLVTGGGRLGRARDGHQRQSDHPGRVDEVAGLVAECSVM